MIELRLKAVAQANMSHGQYYIPLAQYLPWDQPGIDKEPAWAVLQYREGEPLDTGEGVLWNIDWTDVEISDE